MIYAHPENFSMQAAYKKNLQVIGVLRFHKIIRWLLEVLDIYQVLFNSHCRSLLFCNNDNVVMGIIYQCYVSDDELTSAARETPL